MHTARLLATLTFLLLGFTYADPVYLGGIDMPRACAEQYGMDWFAIVTKKSCDGWKCVHSITAMKDIDTPRACVDQHGAHAYAQCGGAMGGKGVFDWRCWRD